MKHVGCSLDRLKALGNWRCWKARDTFSTCWIPYDSIMLVRQKNCKWHMMVQYVCSSTLMQVHITISTYPAVSLNKLRVAIDGNLMSHVDYPGCWKQNAPRGSCTRSCKLCATGGALDVPNRAKSQFLWELVVSTVHAAAIAAAGPVQYSFFFPLALLFCPCFSTSTNWRFCCRCRRPELVLVEGKRGRDIYTASIIKS